MDVAVAGTAAVWLALGASLAAAGGAVTGRRRAGDLLVVAGLAAGAATGVLAWALVTVDLRLVVVADTTRRGASWPARLSGLWGGMSGSLLVWTSLLLGAAVVGCRAVRRSRPDLVPATVATLGAVCAGFLAVSATVARPFDLLAIPATDGGGLAPVLERPAMLYHPPLLYAGLVAMVVPFAVAVAGLGHGGLDRRWLRVVGRATGAAWVALTLGLVAGAHWAYGELGWGGFWAWDPIENAGLLPWLAATAVLHAVLVDEHRRRPRWSTAVLATLPFLLSVLAAVLTRSGAASSVHAFAEARAVGHALVGLLGALVAMVVLVAVGGRGRHPVARRWRWSARRAALAGNGVLLGGVGLVVATGTLQPLASDLGGEPVAVAGWFFARFTAPLALIAMAAVGVAPQLRWSGGPRPGLVRAAPAAAVAAVVVGGWAVARTGTGQAFAVVAFALGAGSAVLLLADVMARLRSGPPGAARRRGVGAAVAHLGLVVLLVGVAGSTLSTETTLLLGPGEEATVAGATLRHEGVSVVEGRSGRRVSVAVRVRQGGRTVATLHPAQQVFPEQGALRADPALRSTPAADLQVVLRRLDAEGTALLDVGVRPLVVWVWWGAVLIALGGAMALGGPRRALRPGPEPVPAAAEPRPAADPARARP